MDEERPQLDRQIHLPLRSPVGALSIASLTVVRLTSTSPMDKVTRGGVNPTPTNPKLLRGYSRHSCPCLRLTRRSDLALDFFRPIASSSPQYSLPSASDPAAGGLNPARSPFPVYRREDGEMRIEQAIEDCHRWAREHAEEGQELLDDLYRRQLEADIKFREASRSRPSLRPVFLSEAQRDLVQRASQVLLDCAERLIEQYMVDPEVRETIGFLPDEEEFALLDTGLKRQVVVARPDSFLNGRRSQVPRVQLRQPGRSRVDRSSRGGLSLLADHERAPVVGRPGKV